MVSFTATIKKFGKQGEKTGWTYIEIPAAIAQQIKPDHKQSFRVKGKLDRFRISAVALIPMGGGSFIMALNGEMRKGIAKKEGGMLQVQLSQDEEGYRMNADFMNCLADDPAARSFFQSLPGAHQRYFSRWIDSAKTEPTRVKRITMAVNALARKWNFPEMLRAAKKL